MSAKKTERLMNLLILLLSSRAYLPKHCLLYTSDAADEL